MMAVMNGTTFGGNGQDTFGLPDLRAQVDVGVGGNFPLGEIIGSNSLGISVAQLAAHTHALVQYNITGIQHFTDTTAQVTILGTVGSSCQVDKSDTLVTGSWSNLGTANFSTATQTITDPNPTHVTKRFYYAHNP
jgi:microcystin-dependent protein